jgi:hypothetical protein
MSNAGEVLDLIEGALRDCETSGDAMRWSPDADQAATEGRARRDDTRAPTFGYPPAPPVTTWAGTQLPVDDLASRMRAWADGRGTLPNGLLFCGGLEVIRYLLASHVQHDGIQVALSPDLPDRGWELRRCFDPRYQPPIREGNLADGPTALERGFWLADFGAQFAISPEMEHHAREFASRRLAGLLQACGHDVTEEQVTVTLHRMENIRQHMHMARATVSVPREPVRYPRECGDWLCRDDTHWASADPVRDGAVFAGAVIEKQFTDSMRDSLGGPFFMLGLLEYWHEALLSRRQQAGGEPLWTIDVRPAPFRQEPGQVAARDAFR